MREEVSDTWLTDSDAFLTGRNSPIPCHVLYPKLWTVESRYFWFFVSWFVWKEMICGP